MDKLQMSLDDIIKMEQENGQAGPSTEGQGEQNDFRNLSPNGDVKTSPTNGKHFPNQWNNSYNNRPQRNYIGNRISPWMPYMRNWGGGGSFQQMQALGGGAHFLRRLPNNKASGQHIARNKLRQAAHFLNSRGQQRNGFVTYRSFSNQAFNDWSWRRPPNYSNLTKDALFRFNRINEESGRRRSGSFTNLYEFNGQNQRNNFKRANSMSSLHSVHSFRSNRSRRSNRSNKSRGSNFSNHSRRSHFSNFSGRSHHSRGNQSHHSLRSHFSNRSMRSNHSRKSETNFFPNQNGIQKRHRFFLSWQIQKNIQVMQRKAQSARQNSPMMRDESMETLCPLAFNTGVKLSERFTNNNA